MVLKLASAPPKRRPALLELIAAAPRAHAWGPPDFLALAGIVSVGVLAPGLLALVTHSLGIPIGDDWAFRKVLAGFALTGRYRLVGWGSMALVGQVLWATPFVLVLGSHPWVPSLSVAVLGAGGLSAAYLLARGQLGRRQSVACCLLVAVLPGFALSTWSFMTDVPALGAEMACLLAGAFALRSSGRRQLYWLAGSMTLGLFGFSVREFAVVAPLSVLVVLAAAHRRLVPACLAAGAGLGALCLAIYIWTSGLAGAQPKHLALPAATAWETLAGAYFTLSFMLSPFLPSALWRRCLWRSPKAWAAAALALGLGVFLLAGHHPVFIGNYLGQRGVGGSQVSAGARPVLFPPPLWETFRAVALAAGVALAGTVAGAGGGTWRARLRPAAWSRLSEASLGAGASLAGGPEASERLLVTLFTWGSAALLAGYELFFRAAFWDRYLWPVVFGAAVVLAGRGRATGERAPGSPAARAGAGALSGLLAGLLAVVAAALTLNADAFGAARWSAGESLVAAGYPAQDIDAGFEWVGAHALSAADPARPAAGAPSYETWYDRMFEGFDDCAFVSSSPLLLPSLRLVRISTYNEVAFGIPERLYWYQVAGGHCGARKR